MSSAIGSSNGSSHRGDGKKTDRVRFQETLEVVGQEPEEVVRPPKRKRVIEAQPNVDEMDDVEDFVLEDDEKEMGESRALQAKRKRRLKQLGVDDDNDDGTTTIDRDTSLASEGIPIEPFHMKGETTDGTGYFDGDTYIFRRGGKNNLNYEEPDAWLDNFQEQEEGDEEQLAKIDMAQKAQSSAASLEKMDSLSQTELYAKLLPLVSDRETVAQAIVRYGALLNAKKPKGHKNGKNHAPPAQDEEEEEENVLARQAMNTLTEVASALMLKGDVNIYQQTRFTILKLLSLDQEPITTAPLTTVVRWEYRGNEDGQIHGPFTTQQMNQWIQQGYFVGPTAVQIRTVTPKPAAAAAVTSVQEELLSDLMDDWNDSTKDDDDDDTSFLRGEWIMSDQVDFATMLNPTFSSSKTEKRRG